MAAKMNSTVSQGRGYSSKYMGGWVGNQTLYLPSASLSKFCVVQTCFGYVVTIFIGTMQKYENEIHADE